MNPEPSKRRTYKHPSGITLHNLSGMLFYQLIEGVSIEAMIQESHPIFNRELLENESFCLDDYSFDVLKCRNYPFSTEALAAQAQKRQRFTADTIEFNNSYQHVASLNPSNVKLYKPDYIISFGNHAGKSVTDVLNISPSTIEKYIQTLDWFGLTLAGINFLKSLEPNFIFLKSTFGILEEKYKLAPDYMKPGYARDYQDHNKTGIDLEYESEYSGSWAYEEEGFSDEDIDSAFDGDPDAYWNID